jgi:light-regulated signal transduction histidine kinase (bacteriophytochrome)
MSKLIDTLLDFSRLSRSNIVREKVDLSGLVTEIAAELRLTAPERRVSFNIAKGITAYGDVNLLRIVLANIIGNAWKFSANNEKAIIEFGMTECDGKPAHFVRDNGVGFDMAQMDDLFTPFHRLHCREGFAGHGIGLATVRRIIQRHGGRVWAVGKPDEGATFFFTLPEQ